MNLYNKTTIVIVVKIVCIITLSMGESKISAPATSNNSVKTNATTSNKSENNIAQPLNTVSQEIIAEGGGRVQVVGNHPLGQLRGRENELQTKPDKNITENSSKTHTSDVDKNFSVDKLKDANINNTNLNRNISKEQTKLLSTPEVNATESSYSVKESIKPFDIISEKNDNKKTVPRKGVVFEEPVTNNTNVNMTTVKPKVTKPTLTIGADDEPYAPSHFETSKTKLNASAQSIPKVPSVKMVSDNKHDGSQKYVLPIVVVILSVPFVAIIISVMYKRGTEWWEHRHYRRMDFLINGMYDN